MRDHRRKRFEHRGAEAALLLAAAVCSVGCTRLDTSKFAAVPPYKVDMYASEVTWLREDGEAISSDTASVKRVEITSALDDLVAARPDVARGKPARFATRIVKLGSGDYDVTLRFQVGEKRYSSHAAGDTAIDGVYAALYKGAYPQAGSMPNLYVKDLQRSKTLGLGFGIPTVIVGTGLVTYGALIAAFTDYHGYTDPYGYTEPGESYIDGLGPLLLTSHVLAAGVVLIVFGVKKDSSAAKKPAANSASVQMVGPSSLGFRLDF